MRQAGRAHGEMAIYVKESLKSSVEIYKHDAKHDRFWHRLGLIIKVWWLTVLQTCRDLHKGRELFVTLNRLLVVLDLIGLLEELAAAPDICRGLDDKHGKKHISSNNQWKIWDALPKQTDRYCSQSQKSPSRRYCMVIYRSESRAIKNFICIHICIYMYVRSILYNALPPRL